MDNVTEMLFSLQRFQVLTLYTSTSAERTVSDSYAYAWFEGVYPLLHETAPWHKPYESAFVIKPVQMNDLYAYLSEAWRSKKIVTFFQMEDHYGIKGSKRPGPVWSQANLILGCRYLYLSQKFDAGFWVSLLSGSQCPMEAEAIARKFSAIDIHFE